MAEQDVHYISLCKVSSYNNKIWLYRLGDVVNDSLRIPVKSRRIENIFENRESLYFNDGPSEEGTIGIWEWTAVPNISNPDIDYVRSYYVHDISPVRVIKIPYVTSLIELIHFLKGKKSYITVYNKPYICDTMFCYENGRGRYNGVLVNKEDFTYDGQKITFKDNVYSLQCYVINEDDIFYSTENDLMFLQNLRLGAPKNNIIIRDTDELIKEIVLNRFSWPLYKETIGKTRAEWRECKTLFERITVDSVYDEISNKLGCYTSEAKSFVDKFLEKVDENISAGDIDTEILVKLILNHEELRSECEIMAKSDWEKNHKHELDVAQKDVDLLNARRNIIEKQQKQILTDIQEKEKYLEKLTKDIEKAEKLGKETKKAIQKKISDAQEDMSGFVSELLTTISVKSACGSPVEAIKGAWSISREENISNVEEEILDCKSWESTFENIEDNLISIGINHDLAKFLAAFLLAAYYNKVVVLLAGPESKNIANAFSCALVGKGASILKCYGVSDVSGIITCPDDEIIAVENPFNMDWLNIMDSSEVKGRISYWLHPFTEDLIIEPKGIYNYVLPVFTELFLEETVINPDMVFSIKSLDYKDLEHNKSRIKSKLLKDFGVNKLAISRFQKILSDAKCMCGSNNSDLEYLFAVLPFSFVNDKYDLLKEMLEEEQKKQDLTFYVREEIEKYIEG